jgi:site-specific recombinase XerC
LRPVIAPHITAYLRERLPQQQGASPHTCDSYAHTFRLLFEFASDRFKVTPSKLYLEQIDAQLVMDFLVHLESSRSNSAQTRNVRLAAIKSFMRFVEHRVPSLLEQSLRILAIPSGKRRPKNYELMTAPRKEMVNIRPSTSSVNVKQK